MTLPSQPDDHRSPNGFDDDDEIPSVIPQSLMTALSAVIVVALIIGSASSVLAFTEWGLNAAGIIGLGLALLLIVIWLRMPARNSRG